MIKSKKLFIIAVIIGIFAVIGLAGYLSIDRFQAEPLNAQNPKNSNQTQERASLSSKATGKVDDLIDSLEKDLYEQAAVVYEEDQDANSVNGDSEEIDGMTASTDGGELE